MLEIPLKSSKIVCKMLALDEDLQLKLLAWLPFDCMPVASRVCRLWRRLSQRAFRPILRWRGSADVQVLEDHLDKTFSEDFGQSHRIGRVGGAIDFSPNGKMIIQRAVPMTQQVATIVVDMQDNISDHTQKISISERPMRCWPYDFVTGGMRGGLVGHRTSLHDGQRRMAFFPSVNFPDGTVSESVVEVQSQDYENILRAGEQLFLLKKAHWWSSRSLPADVLHLITGRKVQVCVAHMRDRLREVLDGEIFIRQACAPDPRHPLRPSPPHPAGRRRHQPPFCLPPTLCERRPGRRLGPPSRRVRCGGRHGGGAGGLCRALASRQRHRPRSPARAAAAALALSPPLYAVRASS